MSMLFINDKDIKDLHDEIEEEFGLKPSNNNSKDNKEKKQTVEERIINRCNLVQRGCSLALDQHPYAGPVKNAIELKTGKDFITEEELTPAERAMAGLGVVFGVAKPLAKVAKIGPIGLAAIEAIDDSLEIGDMMKSGTDALELGMDAVLEKKKERDADKAKNQQRNKSRSKSRSTDRSRSRNRNKDKGESKNEKRGRPQKKKK